MSLLDVALTIDLLKDWIVIILLKCVTIKYKRSKALYQYKLSCELKIIYKLPVNIQEIRSKSRSSLKKSRKDPTLSIILLFIWEKNLLKTKKITKYFSYPFKYLVISFIKKSLLKFFLVELDVYSRIINECIYNRLKYLLYYYY